jgi:hypothetical protein
MNYIDDTIVSYKRQSDLLTRHGIRCIVKGLFFSLIAKGASVAYEVKTWKAKDCVLTFKVSRLSDRESFSREINEAYGEGGGLNAGYDTVEAAVKVANLLGLGGLREGKHFVFKTGGAGDVSFDFRNQDIRNMARSIIEK